MTTLEDVLIASDQRTAFEAFPAEGEAWIAAEVAPSDLDGFWHVAVFETGGTVVFLKRPVKSSGVDIYLSCHGVNDATFYPVPRDPSYLNRWDDSGSTKSRSEDTRDVYFIQAVEGGLIKVGVAHSPEERLASIQRMSPVRLRIIGSIHKAGQHEERRLHKKFAEFRSHGEWFHPAPELLDYIRENS